MANKREIDKDEMFRKIMPSAGGAAPAEAPAPPAEAAPHSAQQQPAQAMAEEEPTQVTVPMPATAEGEPYPVNVAELMVEAYYPRYRERLDGCECARCRDDVFGIALNKITPHYVPSDKLTEEDFANRELITETVTALMKAIFIVKRNPHHDDIQAMRQ